MRFMWSYARKYSKYIIINILSVFGFILIEIGLPSLLASAINQGFAQGNLSYVHTKAIQMVIFTFIGLAGLIILSYSTNRMASSVIRDIRTDIYRKAQDFSHEEYEEFGVSRMITSTTNDPYQIMMFLSMMLRLGLITPLMFISSFVMIFIKGGSIAYVVLAGLPLLALGVIVLGKKSQPLSVSQQDNLDKINLTMRETLTGLRVIRAFNNEDFQEERFDEVNKKYTDVSRRLFQLMAIAMPAFALLFTVILAFILWFGAGQVQTGIIEFGTLAAFVEYVWHALFSFASFAMVFMMYPRAAVSARRIEDLLNAQPSITENPDGVTAPQAKGVVEFNNVSFAYADNAEEPVLRNVSFRAEPGETVAFIGSTGSGKSTLIQLLPRFFDVTSGEILVDGVDVRDYRLSSLRDNIGYIPQRALLFSGTIAENIRFGKPDATLEEVKAAADIAQASDFISQRPEGYNSYLAEGGTNLSGGQKQRLSIARALIKQPAIYVFDDSFSALDYQTDAKLRKDLSQVTTHATIFIVAQRVSTIRGADKIIVLDKGSVVGIGTHKELLETSQIYYEIASSQLSKEELA